MENILLLVLLIVVVGVALVIFSLRKKVDSQDQCQRQLTEIMSHQGDLFKERFDFLREDIGGKVSKQNETIFHLQRSIDHRLGENSNRLDNAAKSYAQVTNKITELQEATNKVFEVGKDISSLQEILRAPKIRGGFGEVMLENILSQILPRENYALQYKFKNGETVDAVIKLKEGLISVDSKFPLENFQKMLKTSNEQEKREFRKKFISDVKKHVDAIAEKYILPDEKTFNLALMYITAENVYYETIIKDEEDLGLLEYFSQKRVIPVSPNSFYAYLITVAKGLQGMEIEKKAKEIMNNLERLRGEYGKFNREFLILGRHITDTKNKYEIAEKRLDRFGDRLEKVQIETIEEAKEENQTKLIE